MAHRKLTHAEFLAEAEKRFGKDPLKWAFACPNCSDTATGLDFTVALTSHPRTDAHGREVRYWEILGQECIGRTLGALSGDPTTDQGRGRAERGCDWAAYGLIRGPWEIVLPEGQSIWCFPLADQAGHADPGTADTAKAGAR
ncbi:VVA0879 family protein [Nonomuraea sp. 10N515B]|uniref:VVA0879 family protein n=1 Tax=Nonomuraea sp. 10N515B TaxID=3457422 RepID=UPI003FCCCE72